MRRVRFRDVDGRTRIGDWTDAGIEFGDTVYDSESVDILPPTEPSKIIGCSTNNIDLIEKRDDLEWPDRPKLFFKTPNTVVGHRDTAKLMPDKKFVYEGELAAVIGEQCKDVSAADAMDVIAGFTCLNDITNHTDKDTYAARRKATDNTAPVGPVVASPDLVPQDATIELSINGDLKQDSSRERLVFGVPEIIEEATKYFTLEPGDIIPTGSPPRPGSGLLEDGDSVELKVEGVGTLEHETRIVR